jgi:hypothetical protein
MRHDARTELLFELGIDRLLAHQSLFAHRHRDQTPDMHKVMIEDWHGSHSFVQTQAFRGAAKSTIAEEAIIVMAAFQEFKNGLILCETIDRANDRVESIRHEIETNEFLAEVFGDLRGPTWAEGELVFSNGVRLLGLGRGSSIRGIKFHDARPDVLFVDDIEDDESVKSPTLRKKTKTWFTKTLIPACDPRVKVRVAATPLDPDSLSEDLRRDPFVLTRVFPIEHMDDNGVRTAAWPRRFPLAAIDRIRESFRSKGLLREFNMEYMCQASTDDDKPFLEKNFRVEPRVRTWEAVFGMFDPARTVSATSATTGFAAWSWVGPKMYVWESWGRRLMPSEIIEAMFDFNERYSPVWVGAEEDGLNEWLLQPIRQESTRRGVALPLKAVKAPKGKISFIRGLQPFFSAHEVWFAGDCAELRRQLLNFPTGEIDAPNALAYALRMRSGAPVYDDFGQRHIAERLLAGQAPYWLCLNATPAMVTGVLSQVVDGQLRVFGDFVREGDAGSSLLSIVQAAQIEAGRTVRLTCGPQHFDRYNNFGLVQAAKAIPTEIRTGVEPGRGRAHIRSLLVQDRRGGQGVQVASDARWTLNGFSSGYARTLLKGGALADYAEEGPYRTLLEGLESFIGLMVVQDDRDDDGGPNYAYDKGGRRYASALMQR